MAIFQITKNKAVQIPLKKDGFGNEAELRDFFAENLEELLGVRFLAKEYPTPSSGRMDSIGVDENNSPVIIEYKWTQNEEVFTQGLSYYDWLQSNKRHFELEAQKKFGQDFIVNWDQPRVILIAQGFNRRIQGAVKTVDMVELKTYNYYAPNTLQLENLYTPDGVALMERETSTGDEIPTIIPEYNLDYHLGITSKEMAEAFNKLRDKILELPEVIEKADQKSGVTYKTTKSFTRFEFRPTWIQVLVRDAKYPNDDDLVTDVTTYRWWYLGAIKFYPTTNIETIFRVLKASYESTL